MATAGTHNYRIFVERGLPPVQSITRRWLRGSLLITICILAAALGLFLYYSHQNLYGGVQRAMQARFSTVEGRLQATGTAGSSQATSESRSQSLRRTVEQFDEKDKFEFMLLDSSGVVLATSSGTMNKNLLSEGRDFYQAVTGSTGSGMVTFRTADGEHVMAVTSLVPYAAGNVTAMRLVTSLTLVDRQWYSTLMVSFGVAAVVLFTVLLIVETFRLLLPGLWSAFSAGDEQALSEYLASQGRLRSFLTLWFLAVVQVLSLVIPAMPVQLAAGLAYGPWMGFLTSFSASAVANMSVYLIARRLVPVIRRLVADTPKAAKLLDSVRSSKDPWFYTILAFITPGLPNGIIPYAAAHANMKPKQFFAAICISMPIPTLLTCLAGSYLVTGDWLFTVLIEGGMFAVVGLLFHKRSAVIGHAHEVKDRHTR